MPTGWTRDVQCVHRLKEFERRIIEMRLKSEPDGCGLWVTPWQNDDIKQSTVMPGPSFGLRLVSESEVDGAFVAPASLWPVADSSLGYIVLQHVFEFAADPEELLAEAARSLRGHGRLLIFGFRGLSAARISKRWRQKPAKYSPAYSWAQVCRALGLADISVERFGSGWPWLDLDDHSWLDHSVPSLTSAFVLSARKRAIERIGTRRALAGQKSPGAAWLTANRNVLPNTQD